MEKNEMKMEKVTGTNCYNCRFIADQEEKVDPAELNPVGGIDPKDKHEMKRAEKADLITLPGGTKSDATTKKYCKHKEISMYVTVRMCCGYWDNVGVKRPWKAD
jgi:hypothetical protein